MDHGMKRIRIEFDEAKCIGSEPCYKADPQTYGFDHARATAVLLNGKAVGERLFSVDITGSPERIKRAIDGASSCPVNAFVVMDIDSKSMLVGNQLQTQGAKEVKAQYDDSKEFTLDPKGYFLIRINYETNELEAGFCGEKNAMVLKVSGKKPIDVYHTIATKTELDLRKEHFAYLGRELEKAYHCLMTNLEYVQDDELHNMKPRKAASNK